MMKEFFIRYTKVLNGLKPEYDFSHKPVEKISITELIKISSVLVQPISHWLLRMTEGFLSAKVDSGKTKKLA